MFDKLNLKLCTKTYLQMILRDIKRKNDRSLEIYLGSINVLHSESLISWKEYTFLHRLGFRMYSRYICGIDRDTIKKCGW